MKIYVVIDTISVKNNLLSLHGMSLLIETKEAGLILFGIGPSYDVLVHNLTNIGFSLKDINFIIIPMSSRPFAGALQDILSLAFDFEIFAPPDILLSHERIKRVLRITSISRRITLLPPLGKWRKEIIMIINILKDNYALIIPCSHLGVINTINYALSFLKKFKIYSIIGGFHLSDYDVLTFNELMEIIRKLDVKKVVPLYCTSIKVRDKILKHLNLTYKCGVGLELQLP